MNAADLATALRTGRGFGHKTDIAGMLSILKHALPAGQGAEERGIVLGDDCAAIADGAGHLLFAIEAWSASSCAPCHGLPGTAR